ncbi:PAS domain-containing protein [Epilithonimonas sp. JDS]|uniref:PAS domain-containing sensor histidine kinase n=1 Tax=Epilithonimonas sp. JDS TaxID=2902797 RepID=UPI001E4EA527|nr:ATP-binding protein [Epilithonimonas sp. JDS]MCD9855389.1 PAS domain-containing protein [Epilithonimonas sp. JDS]
MKNFLKSNISQESLALLLTQAPIALSMLMGDDFIIQVANPQILELWGKPANIIGSKLLDALPEIKDQPFIDFLKNVKKTGNPYKGYKQLAYIVRNGKTEECYFDFIYAPIYNDDESEIIGVSVVATETTDQVLAERKVAETEYKFETLIKEADYAIGLYAGKDHIIEVANDKILNAWGKTNAVIGKKIREGIPELEGQPFLQILKDVYETGETYSASEDKVLLEKNGKLETFYYNFSYKPLKNENGEVYAILNFATDVTDLVLAKKQVQDNEDKYKNLADSLPIIIWTADKDGNIDYYNKKWYDYTGFEGIIDDRKSASQKILHPDDVDKAMKVWKTSQKNKTGYEIEYQFKDREKENGYRWFLGKAVPIKNDQGEVIQWIGTCTDIDEFKQFQQQKDNFLGIASHELKTPLTSLKLYSQFLEKNLKKQDDHNNAVVALKMDEQINKLNNLINDLLDVTKIQNGKILLNTSEFNFDALVNEIVEEQQMSTNHRIYLESESIGNILGDRDRISQVMSNLINNAIKYSPNSDKIQIKSKLLENNNILFCVKDYGIGIPENKKDRVFEQYYRVSGTKEHTFPGLGLGLYISSEIIKRSGGKIFVNSVEGKGSDFCFEIPRAKTPN